MAEPKKYRFVQPLNWTAGFPVTWPGWACLFSVFALKLLVTRELQGRCA